jgi:hypothetical protein
MQNGTNAPCKPQFEGQIIKFRSPHANAMLYDICKLNKNYNCLEWWALDNPSETQKQAAFLAD